MPVPWDTGAVAYLAHLSHHAWTEGYWWPIRAALAEQFNSRFVDLVAPGPMWRTQSVDETTGGSGV